MKKAILYGLLGIFGYMPGVYAAVKTTPPPPSRTITIINNTGATVEALLKLSQKCQDKSFTINVGETKPLDIGNCCFRTVNLKVKDGRSAGKSAMAYGPGYPKVMDYCGDATFTIEIKNGELTWFRK